MGSQWTLLVLTAPAPGAARCALATSEPARRPNRHYLYRMWSPDPGPSRVSEAFNRPSGAPKTKDKREMILALRYHGLAPRGYYHAPRAGLHKVGRTCCVFPSTPLCGHLRNLRTICCSVCPNGHYFYRIPRAVLCVLGLLCAGSVAFLPYPKVPSASSAISAVRSVPLSSLSQ